jgi:peroxygenase
MDLVLRDRRSLENRESRVGEDALVCLTRRPIFARHEAVVGGGGAPGQSIALVVGAHTVEAVTSRQPPFEVIDVRELGVRHDFFDTDRDGKITLLDTYQGLRRLGLGALRSAVFGSVINAALGSSTSGAPSLTVDANHIEAGKHGSDTGVFDERGFFVQGRFDRLFARYDGDGDGALDCEELARFIDGNRTDLLGYLGSMAEFGLLLTLAGEDREGRKVLTRQRLGEFYDGSLFYRLADEVRARRADPRSSLFTTVRSSLEELY